MSSSSCTSPDNEKRCVDAYEQDDALCQLSTVERGSREGSSGQSTEDKENGAVAGVPLLEEVLHNLEDQQSEKAELRRKFSEARKNFERTSQRLQDVMRYQKPLSFYAQTFGVRQDTGKPSTDSAFGLNNEPISSVEDYLHSRRKGVPKEAYSVKEIRRLQREVEEQHRAAIGIRKAWRFDRSQRSTEHNATGPASNGRVETVKQTNKLWPHETGRKEAHSQRPPRTAGNSVNDDILRGYDDIERRYNEIDREERGSWYSHPFQRIVDLGTRHIFNNLPLRWRVYCRQHRVAISAVLIVFIFNHRLVRNLVHILLGVSPTRANDPTQPAEL